MTLQKQFSIETPPAFHDFPRTIRVGLAGCGVVGGGFVRLLHESAPAIAARFGVRFDLTRVLVRDPRRERNLPLDSRLFTNDLDAFLAHDADVIIEAVGGQRAGANNRLRDSDPGNETHNCQQGARRIARRRSFRLAREHDAGLDFGAAVGGSAPVISTLRDLVGASTPRSVRGILNGTSNYIITLLERGVSLDAALASARERGFAEVDCARDLDGRDAAAKLAIIAWIAFGIGPADLHVRRTSLLPGLEHLVRLATTTDAHVRLIAECIRLPGNRVSAAVEPVIVPSQSTFGRTTFEENRVEVDLGWRSPLSVSGPGAGGAPTAAALLSDLLRGSPPPNERGAGATQFLSVVDPREHRWLVTAQLDSESLERTATAVGLRTDRHASDGAHASVITAPASWKAVQRLVGALDLLNARPCVARYESFSEAEVLQ